VKYALYAIAAFQCAGALLTITSAGKPRKPLTPGSAAAVTVIAAVIATVLVIAAQRLP
jgi:hypothetical protein